MMTPEHYISHLLTTSPDVAGLVGMNVFNIFVPKAQTELPFVVYRRGVSDDENTVSGPGPLSLPTTSFFVSSWALEMVEARRIGDAVRQALNGQIGNVAGLSVVSLLMTGEVDDFVDPTPAGAQLPLAYEVRQSYQLRWQRA